MLKVYSVPPLFVRMDSVTLNTHTSHPYMHTYTRVGVILSAREYITTRLLFRLSVIEFVRAHNLGRIPVTRNRS